jgi:hypothetical protein
MNSLYSVIMALSVLFLFSTLTQADTLDWDTVNWTDTTVPISQTFTVNGVDITIAITGATNRFYTTGPGGTPPDDVTNLTPGGVQQSLYLAANYVNTTESLTVTVTFNSSVRDISFTIYDVDKSPSGNPFEDQIRTISSTDGTNTYYAAVSGSSSNTAANSGTASATITGTAVSTDGTANGNADISFTGNNVNSFTFTWGSGPGAPSDPLQQWIAISDITYTVVPEPSTYLTGLLLLALVSFEFYRRRNRKIVKTA